AFTLVIDTAGRVVRAGRRFRIVGGQRRPAPTRCLRTLQYRVCVGGAVSDQLVRRKVADTRQLNIASEEIAVRDILGRIRRGRVEERRRTSTPVLMAQERPVITCLACDGALVRGTHTE